MAWELAETLSGNEPQSLTHIQFTDWAISVHKAEVVNKWKVIYGAEFTYNVITFLPNAFKLPKFVQKKLREETLIASTWKRAFPSERRPT